MEKSEPVIRIDLVALKQAIIDHAEQLYMPWWMTGADEVSFLGQCGTTLCIGGMACILAGDTVHRAKNGYAGPYVVTKEGESILVVYRVIELLGPVSDSLFDWQFWPDRLKERFRYAFNAAERASIACEAIGYFTNSHSNQADPS